MNQERIQALISSDKDDKEIAKKLIKWFIAQPDLIDSRYILDRTVFHLLVIKKKHLVLEALLEDTTWKILQDKSWLEIAASADRNGWTLFHYAARGEENTSATMDVLFKYFPNKMDTQNNYGNTPLHEAIVAQRLWAVKKLVSKKCDRSIKNNDDKTALELAELNSELRLALLAIDLSTINSLDLRYRAPAPSNREESPTSLNSVRESCPLLSTGRSSDPSISSSSSLDSLHSSLRYPNSGASEASSSDLSVEQEADVDKQQVIANKMALQLLKNLVKAYQTNKRSVISVSLHNEFNELCMKSLLADDFDLSNEPLFKFPENRQIIHDTISTLYPRVDELYSRIQNTTYTSINNFLYILASHISIADSNPLIPPVFNTGKKLKDQVQETLWLLTACQVSHESKRTFDFAAITHRALGILSSLSLFELLVNLRALYPYFDKDQKIIANVVVLQLLYYNAIDRVNPKSKLTMQIRFLTKLNIDVEKGLGKLGEDINQHLLKIHDLCSSYTKRPLLRNYYILNQGISQPDVLKLHKSFDTIVDQALTKNRAKRTEEVGIIAHELRMLTISFYQHASISEFHNKNWEKTDVCPEAEEDGHACDTNCVKAGKSTLAPHIVEFTEHFNKLSNYFVVKILSQPRKNIKNALQLLIEIAQVLCPLNDEHYPDINHLMVISSVLNNVDISRLINYATDLSAEDNAYRMEIDTITSRNKNFQLMRNVYLQFRTTLPFLGLLLRDMTFAQDGNSNSEKIVRAEACGEILKKLLEIKLLINFEKIHFHTNFPVFLREYNCLDEDHVQRASSRIKPRKSHEIHWEYSSEFFSSNLNTLIKDYLPIDIIPSIITPKRTIKPKNLPVFLIDSITSIIKTFKKEYEKNPSKKQAIQNKELHVLLSILGKLTIAIPEIVRINQLYYHAEQYTGTKSMESLLAKLEELKKSIQPSMPLLELEDKIDPAERRAQIDNGSFKRRSAHFLQGHSIFKSGKVSSDVSVAACSTDVSTLPEQGFI
ncbi:RasGEF domain-containing protein [Legionella bononiensis]|uniref:Ankyrin repeat domain-containing protein n=1 Tax=Legionella bononiensis TaxID=2793102 RepID=A0ABS1WD48_9GAMM|nr:RasGEF domain-containing protein [Legionella bononiensis]MBL7479141.1 ankyrin repeat domain-containing protein [Legionella bononiensis]MBL7527274.1 ankyrin repeat domain-containing protein [Legionella bononiensis]MBL7562243.1 ankyrin repeat domain-containing protein [Legionella bononiensis]